MPKGVVVSSITLPFWTIFTVARYSAGFSSDHSTGLATEMVCVISVIAVLRSRNEFFVRSDQFTGGVYSSVSTVNGALPGGFCDRCFHRHRGHLIRNRWAW